MFRYQSGGVARDWDTYKKRTERERVLGIPAAWGWFDPVVFMAIITPVYLFFELAFNASLLNTTGTIVSNTDIQNIEHWGRAISGIALALFLWGFFLPFAQKRRIDIRLVAAMLLSILVTSVAFTFHYEKVLLNGQVNHSDPAKLRLAYQIQIAEHEVMTGQLKLDGLPQNFNPKSASAKSFFSIFPFMAKDVKHFSQRARPELIQVIKNQITDGNTKAAAAKQYNKTIYVADQGIANLYRTYVSAERRRAEAINGSPQSAQALWQSLGRQLSARGITPDNVPFADWPAVRNHVLRQGIYVPPGWDPADRNTYVASAETHIEHVANNQFAQFAKELGDPGLGFGLSFYQFSHLTPIINKWRNSLHLKPGQDADLSPTTTFPQWEQEYYAPILEKQIQKRIHQIEQPVSAFAQGGPLYHRGYDAMQAMLAPPMALCFSILGALVHLYKSGKYIMLVRFRSTKRQRRIVKLSMLLLVTMIGFMPFIAKNSISRSPIFTTLIKDAKAQGSTSAKLDSTGITWVVQAQPYFYPMNDLFNRTLKSMGFSYAQFDT